MNIRLSSCARVVLIVGSLLLAFSPITLQSAYSQAPSWQPQLLDPGPAAMPALVVDSHGAYAL